MTKPIILTKICYKLLYVIQGVKNIKFLTDRVPSRPQSISLKVFGCTYVPISNAASD